MPFDFRVDVPDDVIEVIEAARSRAVVDVREGDERFLFEPWVVVLRGGAWFAVGHDADRGEQRAVRLGRVPVDVTVLDRPRSGSSPDLDERAVSELAGAIDEELPVAQVLVDEGAVARASLWPNVVERSQVDFFEQVSVRAVVDDVGALRSWLLGLGERAELLAPGELRSGVMAMSGRPPHTPDLMFGIWVDPDEGMVHCSDTALRTDELRLTGRQAAAVSVALSALEALPSRDEEVLASLRKKLDVALGALPVRVELDEPPLLADVWAARERGERVRIEYVDPDDNVTEREFDPLKVFTDRGSSYVLGDDHLRGGERVFRVDRILSVEPTGELFDPRPVDSPAGRTWSWMVEDREVVVRLPPGSDWVLDRHAMITHVAAEDGWLAVWLSVVSERWLATLLLACGPGAEVLSPDDLIDLPTREARRILSRYE